MPRNDAVRVLGIGQVSYNAKRGVHISPWGEKYNKMRRMSARPLHRSNSAAAGTKRGHRIGEKRQCHVGKITVLPCASSRTSVAHIPFALKNPLVNVAFFFNTPTARGRSRQCLARLL